MRAVRGHWLRAEILLRADSPDWAPEVVDVCCAEGPDLMLGVAPTTTRRHHVETLERSIAALWSGTRQRRRYKELPNGAASWRRGERIIAGVEAGPDGTDTRSVVTNLASGAARRPYKKTYCQPGQPERHIKAWKRHLAAERFGACPNPCSRATANQFRLMLHTGAY